MVKLAVVSVSEFSQRFLAELCNSSSIGIYDADYLRRKVFALCKLHGYNRSPYTGYIIVFRIFKFGVKFVSGKALGRGRGISVSVVEQEIKAFYSTFVFGPVFKPAAAVAGCGKSHCHEARFVYFRHFVAAGDMLFG